MVERYVFIKLKETDSGPEGRRAVAERARSVLSGLPGVVAVAVGEPADAAAEAAWDVSIAVRFAQLADIEPYRVHPTHRAFVDDFLAPKMEVIKAWNFEISGG